MTLEQAISKIQAAGVQHAEDKDDIYESIESEAEWVILNYIVTHAIPTPGFKIQRYHTDEEYNEEAGIDPDEINDATKEAFHDLMLKIDADSSYRDKLHPDLITLLCTYYQSFGWADQISWIETDTNE